MSIGRLARGLRGLLGTPGSGRSPGDEPITLPSAAVYLYWDFRAAVDTMEWDLTVQLDPGTSTGEYLALFNGSIDGSMCYLGLQTDIFHPNAGRGIGKGLIFSTWWSFDPSDTRLAPDGFRELGTHEGRFVGIRRPYRWVAGDYRVTLSRSESEAVGGRVLDWFDLWIEPLGALGAGLERPKPLGAREWLGALRFPRRKPDTPAAIEPGGLAFLEVYSAARTWADVSPWRADVMAYGDGVRCPSGRTEYPRPYGRLVPNASVHYDPERERIDLSIGIATAQHHPAAPWP